MSSRPTRWSPTPEQIMILEEMYQKGLKSPNTTQIQMITAHLSMYGKIEGKNVFYWFQNHKARDRQKLRKRLKQLLHHHHHHPFSGPTTTDDLPPPLNLHCPSSTQPRPCFSNTNHHLSCLGFSQPSSSSAGYLFQSTVVEEDALSHQLPTTVDFHQRKTDLPQPSHTTTTVTGWPCTMKTTTYGQDLILMMEAGPTLPCWTTSTTTTPLKTLQLFPTSSTK